MKLSAFIRANLEQIVDQWEAFARTQLPASGTMSSLALRDHANHILEAIADDLETEQTEAERQAKSEGGYATRQSMGAAAATHGALRHASGFTLLQLTAEFRALRSTVLSMWTAQELPAQTAFDDSLMRFNEAVDQAIAESVVAYESKMTQARDLYLAILGHDLRSPLAAIAGVSELLKRSELNDQTRLSVGRILESSASTMRAMIDDLIEYSRTRLGGSLPVEKKDVDLAEICRACADEVKMAHPEATIALDVAGETALWADPERVRQAVSNVLNNAVQHGAQDKRIEISLADRSSYLELKVFNQGPPIPPQQLSAIFDPFRSLSESRPGERRAHLGLGLFIARTVARSHGGELKALESQDGALFVLTLPKGAA